MLAVFNKKKDSIKTYEEAFELEREITSLYIREIKKMHKRTMGIYFDGGDGDCSIERIDEPFDWERVYFDEPFVEIRRRYFDVVSKVRDIRRKY